LWAPQELIELTTHLNREIEKKRVKDVLNNPVYN
jgi:hypothetical protein